MSMFKNNTLLDIIYKLVMGISSTSSTVNYFEEPYTWTPQLDRRDIFTDIISIADNTALADNEASINPAVTKIIDGVLEEVEGSSGEAYVIYNTVNDPTSGINKHFISPYKYGDGYMFILKDTNGITIPPTTGSFMLDYNNGILRFDTDSTSDIMNITLPMSLTIYQYTGRFGENGDFAIPKIDTKVIDPTFLINKTIGLTESPSITEPIIIDVDGLILAEGATKDFIRTGKTITFTNSFITNSTIGEIITMRYEY